MRLISSWSREKPAKEHGSKLGRGKNKWSGNGWITCWTQSFDNFYNSRVIIEFLPRIFKVNIYIYTNNKFYFVRIFGLLKLEILVMGPSNLRLNLNLCVPDPIILAPDDTIAMRSIQTPTELDAELSGGAFSEKAA